MNFNLQEFGVTLVLGAYFVFGLEIILGKGNRRLISIWSGLDIKGQNLQQVFYLALFFALGMIAENISNYWVDNKWFGFLTETKMRQSVLFKEQGDKEKSIVPSSLLRSLADQRKISKFVPHVGERLETHVKENKDFSDFEENLGFFSDRLYYTAKSSVYPEDNIFQEMQTIQIRIDFIRSLAVLSLIFLIVILIIIVFKYFKFFRLEFKQLDFDKISSYYFYPIQRELILLVVFSLFYLLGMYVFVFEEKEYDKRAFGYFVSFECGEDSCGEVSQNNGRKDALPKEFEFDISGLAKIKNDTFLVVHDVKDEHDKKCQPRMGIMTLSKSIREYLPIVFNSWKLNGKGEVEKKEDLEQCKPKDIGYSANDLEAVCPIPNDNLDGKAKDGNVKKEFLITESGYITENDRIKYGRIFHLVIDKKEEIWTAMIKSVLQLPPGSKDIEGLACYHRSGDEFIVLLGKRREEDRGKIIQKFVKYKDGKLSWDDPWFGYFPKEYSFFAPVDPTDKSWRYISDLYMDLDGRLWISTAQDYGWDNGPFKSIVYEVTGFFEEEEKKGKKKSFDLKLNIEKQWNQNKVKVEALGMGEGKNTLFLGTDGEDLGGELFFLKIKSEN